MIAVDTQLLVYAFRKDAVFHSESIRALKKLAESGQPWAIPWPCVHEFLNIATHPKIYTPTAEVEDALRALLAWKKSPSLELLGETDDYFEILSDILQSTKVRGPTIHDARIAAICVAHGVKTLWTIDRDFSRFQMINANNPLIVSPE